MRSPFSRWIGSLKCAFGFHDWRYVKKGYKHTRLCRRCPKREESVTVTEAMVRLLNQSYKPEGTDE